MTDIILESFRAVIIGIIFFYLLLAGKKEDIYHQKGWAYILAGFAFLLFGMLIDITDNFPNLNRYIIIGDTEYEAFLEKVVGYLFGFLLLAIGFWKWIPIVIAHREAERKLKTSHTKLESKVEERTTELKAINEELRNKIIEHKQTEEELRKSEEKYRRLIEGLQDNYFLYSHNTEGIFTYISPSITNVLGYFPQEFLTHYSEYMTDSPSNKEVIQHTDLSIKGIKQPPYNIEIYHKNGSIRTLRVQEVPVFDSKGNVIAVEGIAEDITERKKMQEALLQSEKLKSLGIMTEGIAHEFNNVLAVIQGFAHLLKKKHGDRKKMEQSVSGISNAVSDGTEIVRRMHEFVHAERDTTEFIQLDMRDIVIQAIDLTMPRWKDMAQAKGVIYDIDTEGISEVAPVLGKPSELREVLVNIINNALDAMHNGDKLSFRTWGEDKNVFVSISDTGEGMDEDVQKRISDSFVSTRSPEGKGLGMSISYGTITRHGGKIDLESEMGKGSMFTIRLPLKMKLSV